MTRRSFSTLYKASLKNGNLEFLCKNNGKFLFHPQWLRERSKIFRTTDISNIKHSIESFSINENQLNLSFVDKVKCEYHIPSLISEALTKEGTVQFDHIPIPKPILWHGSNFSPPEFQFADVVQNKTQLINLTENLLTYGISLIKNVEDENKGFFKVIKLLGDLKNTPWGETFILKEIEEIESKREYPYFDLALTSNALLPHNDNPYLHDQPCWQFLFCIENKNPEKGKALWVDGFEAAEKLKIENPEYFDILSSIYVRYEMIKLKKKYYNKIIEVDHKGFLKKISLSNQAGGYLDYSEDFNKMEKFYEARRTFINYLYDSKNARHYEVKEKDLIIMNNWRILHGRTHFEKIRRCLIGGYFDYADIYSKYAFLKSSN